MPIKNRDGSVYKLRGPNPLMEDQTSWDQFVVHNMKFKGETAADDRQVETLNSDFNVRDDFAAELERTKPDIKVVEQPKAEPKPEPKVEPKPVQPEPKVEPVAPMPAVQLPKGVLKVDVYCRPVARRTRDNIHGETKIQYGEPFLFEAVIYKEEDLFIKLWTNVPKAINEGSILFPKAESKRWWKVTDREEKSGGWLITGCPSEFTPSFQGVS